MSHDETSWLDRIGPKGSREARVRALLSGAATLGSGATAGLGCDALGDLCKANLESPEAEWLTREVARALDDSDVAVRRGAVFFFQRASRAPDHGALTRALREDSGRFEGVPDPLGLSWEADLRADLAFAAAQRVTASADEPRLTVRAEALRAGRAGPVIAGLFNRDRAWLLKHAVEIVGSSPDAAEPLLFKVLRAGLSVPQLLEQLKEVVAPDVLRQAISKVCPAGPERDAYLKLI